MSIGVLIVGLCFMVACVIVWVVDWLVSCFGLCFMVACGVCCGLLRGLVWLVIGYNMVDCCGFRLVDLDCWLLLLLIVLFISFMFTWFVMFV